MVGYVNALKGFRLPPMADSNAKAIDFSIAGAAFTATFYWLPDQAIMTMRLANEEGTLYYGNANVSDPRTIKNAVPGARTNTDLIIHIIPTGVPVLSPASANLFILGVAVGRI